MSTRTDNPFREWIRFEQPRLGTRVVYATDDFFAPKERLIAPAEPIYKASEYDDHGKWMDGWESRRRRDGGHDFCIIRLGIAAIIHGVDIDTRYFTGNYPPAASIEGCLSSEDLPGDRAAWRELVPCMEIAGDAHHFVPVDDSAPVSHLRLNIYPDGGVARLRVYGEVRPARDSIDTEAMIDLVAMKHGGRALVCSDEHFGSMHNLNVEEPAVNMGDGWETARRRGPGNDWVVLGLGHPGVIERVELDTAHFKGNYPDRAEIRAAKIESADDLATDSQHWPVLLPESRLQADTLHRFGAELNDLGTVSHVRLNILPDGGVSRLRLYGRISPDGDLP